MKKQTIDLVTFITGIVLLLCAIVTASCLVLDLQSAGMATSNTVLNLLQIVTACLGALYVLTGAKKNPGAVFLKLFYALNILKMLVLFGISGAQESMTVMEILDVAVPLAGYSILGIETNLGEVKSKVIAVVIALVQICAFISEMLTAPQTGSILLGHITGIVISISIIEFIWAKYADKKARGTK